MKRIILLLSVIILAGCCKDNDLSSGQQKALNSELVGTWREIDAQDDSRRYYVFTEDFKLIIYVSDIEYNDGQYRQLHSYLLGVGKIHYHPEHDVYYKYVIKEDVLELTHTSTIQDKTIYCERIN